LRRAYPPQLSWSLPNLPQMLQLDILSVMPAPLVLLLGLAVLLAGAKYFVDGVAGIAASMGVPPLVIGMTVVAFGTSTPELVVNGLSAYRGETALAFGNIVGSCIVNVGLVLAVTAIVSPLRVEPSLITREIPMLLVGVSALLILTFDTVWYASGAGGGDTINRLAREDGLILLLLFAVFLYYTAIYTAANRALARWSNAREDAFVEEVVGEQEDFSRSHTHGLGKTIAITLAGLLGLSIGADWTVGGATAIARTLGISDNIVGLTIVSIGTTLPELAICILAARRGAADIAIGNVVGSNIFNILAIGGVVSTIRPVMVPDGGWLDLGFMALLTIVLLPIAIRSGRTVTRGEGAFLLCLYVAFLAYRLTH
jgi:cation:H+ antiporter